VTIGQRLTAHSGIFPGASTAHTGWRPRRRAAQSNWRHAMARPG
jgi:hypothetical protein